MSYLVGHVLAGSLHISRPIHWLESRFHFSFADYFNPSNQNFGALQVLNDDLVKAGNGFGSVLPLDWPL
jgi:redox-sensitive bicupin YhaK (pirin superfamily)